MERTSGCLLLVFTFFAICRVGAQITDEAVENQHIYTGTQIDALLQKPSCLTGYFPNQSGYLTKVDSSGNESIDTSFTIEQIRILSGDIYLNGWLYLPLGSGVHPLIILTNGGGNITRRIRSFADWMAPILAHCGIAAFVHDKRGTGESEGVYRNTTYEDYITDAGNCAVFLAKHENVDAEKIGIAGASEGGRIAVIAASRFDEIKFVISYEGTVVSAVDDRINAQEGWLKSLNLPDSTFKEVFDLHEKSIRAWASNNAEEHKKLNQEIYVMREKYEAQILPWTKEEMDSISDFEIVLPTWYSLSYDYLSEMQYFRKKWLAIFGKEDPVVPTVESITNILHYMTLSGNEHYNIAVLPDCAHGMINLKTKQLIRVNHMIINWIEDNNIISVE